MASLFSGLGNSISGLGTALKLPDLGIGSALGGSHALPGALQGVSPTLYAGVGGIDAGNAPQIMKNTAPVAYAQIDPNPDSSALGYGGGGAGTYGAAGGGVGAYNANTDPNLVGQARGQVQNLLPQLNALYASLNSQADQYAQDRRGQIDSAYGDEYNNNDKAYANAVDGTNANYAARGAFDSSFRGNANQQNTDAYNASNTGLHNSQNDAYSQLGSIVAQNKAQFGQAPQYDLSQYNDVNSLLDLRDQLNQHLQNLQGQQTSLMTGGQLRDQLNAVAPAKSNLSTVLQSKLDALKGANVPPEAQYGLAQGYISRSGLSKDEQQKYLQQYLAPAAPAGV